jgi:hypothetical protein
MVMIDKIVILNCFKREKEGKILKKIVESSTKIPVEIAYDDGKSSNLMLERMWTNYLSGLKINNNKGKFILFIHDDMLFGRDAFDKIEYILQFMPNNAFISFFNPNNKDYRDAYHKGHRILITHSNFWAPVLCYPIKLINKYIEFGNQKQFYNTSEDFRIVAFCKKYNIPIYSIVPSLFQHLGPYRSAIGNSGKIGKNIRYSLLYKPESNHDIDWKKELENPYISEKNWGIKWEKYI